MKFGVVINFGTTSDPRNGKKWKKSGGPEHSENLNLAFGRSEKESEERIEHNLPFYKFNQSPCPGKSRKLTC